MRVSKTLMRFGLVLASVLLFTACEKDDLLNEFPADVTAAKGGPGGGGGGGGGAATVGNNLSFPVIWSEGVAKALRTPPAGLTTDDVKLTGDWWYVWGADPIDPQAPLYSCHPEVPEDVCYPLAELPNVWKAYVQKDANNYWQAYAGRATGTMNVDLIDWGDDLESVPWTLTSKVRTEVVLYENLLEPVRQYPMRHVYSWGADEVHGLQTTLDGNIAFDMVDGMQATVFSPHARFTIQKLSVGNPSDITWSEVAHAWVGPNVLTPIFNKAVWEAADGPGYYNAEVNVKGKIIYGYTWDVKTLNSGSGIYRLTFSFDKQAGGTNLNTFFDEATKILIAEEVEEGVIIAAEDDGEPKGGVAYIDVANNLTYMDIVILPGKSGGKGGGGGGKPIK